MEATLARIDHAIATIAAQHNEITYRLLLKIREMDELRGWETLGFVSCAAYLSHRIGLSPSAAREHVRVASSLERLPLISEAMANGTLSFSKARALVRIAKAENEAELLAVAQDLSAAGVEKIVRGVRKRQQRDDALKREEARSLSYFVDDDGMIVFNARLLADEGAVLLKALESVKAKHIVDALVVVAERSLSGEESGSADRYQVVVHVDEATLTGNEGRAEIDGVGDSAESCRRVACDSSVVTMVQDKDGRIVHTTAKTRTIPTVMRRMMRERDGEQCRFPGCSHRIVDGHHLVHWADGGETALSNIVSLCRTHHRYVHELGFGVRADGEEIVFTDRDGRRIDPKPAPLPKPELSMRALDWRDAIDSIHERA